MFTTSAESVFAASSKDTRVRVEASAKKRITVFPRSGGARRTGRPRISIIAPVVSRTASISARLQSSVSRTSRRVQRNRPVSRGVSVPSTPEGADLIVVVMLSPPLG